MRCSNHDLVVGFTTVVVPSPSSIVHPRVELQHIRAFLNASGYELGISHFPLRPAIGSLARSLINPPLHPRLFLAVAFIVATRSTTSSTSLAQTTLSHWRFQDHSWGAQYLALQFYDCLRRCRHCDTAA